MFQDTQWRETLYQRTNSNEYPASFGQKLISAAANHELRVSKKHDSTSRPFHASDTIAASTRTNNQSSYHAGSSSYDASNNYLDEIVAFFAKTPPPPRHRRPHSYQHRFRSNNYNRGNQHRGYQPRFAYAKTSTNTDKTVTVDFVLDVKKKVTFYATVLTKRCVRKDFNTLLTWEQLLHFS